MNNDSASRILDALRRWVEQAPPGTRLPSTRALVAEHAASPVTVGRAVRRLAAEGLVETRPGVGTFTRPVAPRRPASYTWQTAALGAPTARISSLPSTQRTSGAEAVSLHTGYPSGELLPERLVRAAVTRAARTQAAITRAPAAGLPDLQAWFATEAGAHAPAGTPTPAAHDALVIAGSQSGLSSLLRALVGPGRPLVIESPTYWGALLAAEQAGVTLVPVAAGPEGPDVDELQRAFSTTGARAFYAQPTFANPTGASWSAVRAEEVLAVVREHRAFLIEDDWARDLGIEEPPPPLVGRDPDGHVIYLRSLTKSVSPALRLAAIVARGPARERILADRAAEAMYVSPLLQAAALDVVTQPAWSTHRRTVRHQLGARRDALVRALADVSPELAPERIPAGGLNLWLRLPEGTHVARLVRDCESRGVLIADGAEWFPAEPSAPFVRLNYAGDHPDRFPTAAAVIGELLAEQQGRP